MKLVDIKIVYQQIFMKETILIRLNLKRKFMTTMEAIYLIEHNQ